MRSLRLAFALIALGLLATGLTASQGAPSYGPANPGPWAVHPIAPCRYEIDTGSGVDPHGALATFAHAGLMVCPFVGGRSATVSAMAISYGNVCDLKPPMGMTVTRTTLLSLREQAEQYAACSPLMRPTPPEDTTAPGGVYVITVHDPINLPWEPQFTSDQAVLQQEQAWRLIASSGLPVGFAEVWGENGTNFYCFEMMKGADVDPLTFLKKRSPLLAQGAHERRSDASNCILAARRIGANMPIRQRTNPFEAQTPNPAIPTFRVSRSSASPDHQAYRSAVLDSFRSAGLETIREADDPNVRTLLPDKDTYARFDIQVGQEARGSEGVAFDINGFGMHLTRLTPAVCAALFSALVKTDSFITPRDEKSGAITPDGIHGSPADRHVIIAQTWVHSPTEVCSALQGRWKAVPVSPQR